MKLSHIKQKFSIFIIAFLFALQLSGCSETSKRKSTEETASAPATIADVPYQVQLKSIGGEDFPGLHSMIYAVHGDKLILMAGRTNGLHNFPAEQDVSSQPAFPQDKKNDNAFLIELATGKVLATASVNNLPQPIVQQLTATNTEYTVYNDTLYVAGGYGYTNDGKSMTTLDQVMAVSLSSLTAAISSNSLNENFAAQSMYVGNHPALAITGGSLESAGPIGGSSFVLIFGHQYDGLYSPGGGTATQVYSQTARQFNFQIGSSGQQLSKPYGQINVQLMGIYPPTSRTEPKVEQYHRRDLTVLPLYTPTGGGNSAQITALGGVFVTGQMAGYVNPVYITGDGSNETQSVSLTVDTNITQLMSQYEVATLPVYSINNNIVYATFFGGISQYYWKDGKLNHDTPDFNAKPPIDGLPFINTVSTLTFTGNGGNQYLHNDQYFPPKGMEPTCGTSHTIAPYLGAETMFVPSPAVTGNPHDQLSTHNVMLDDITVPTVVGYLVGGIASGSPYSTGNTCASNKYYEVTLIPNQATATTKLVKP